MVDYLKLLSSLSVGSWYQNVSFYAFMVFFIYLNLDIISARAKTEAELQRRARTNDEVQSL
jgi:hypothetical protein